MTLATADPKYRRYLVTQFYIHFISLHLVRMAKRCVKFQNFYREMDKENPFDLLSNSSINFFRLSSAESQVFFIFFLDLFLQSFDINSLFAPGRVCFSELLFQNIILLNLLQSRVSFNIWDLIVIQSFWEKLHFRDRDRFLMFWNLSLESLAINRSSSWTKGKKNVRGSEWYANHHASSTQRSPQWKESGSDTTWNWCCVSNEFHPSIFFCDLFVVRNVTLEFLLIITDIQSEIFPLQERRIDVRRSSRVNNFSSHFIYSQVISISSLTGRRLKSMISPKILMFGIWGGEKDHDRNEHFCWIDFQWQLHPLRYWTERPAVAFEMFFWALLDGVECVMTRRNLLNHCIAMTIIRGWNLSIPLQLLSGVVEWTTQKPDENFGGVLWNHWHQRSL